MIVQAINGVMETTESNNGLSYQGLIFKNSHKPVQYMKKLENFKPPYF